MATTLFKATSLFLALLSCVEQVEASSIPAHRHLHRKRAPAPLLISSTLPSGWKFASCYTDKVNSRSLKASVYTSGTAMTQESCVAYCANLNYAYAGAEYAGECYCDNTLGAAAVQAPLTDCNMGCSGNKTESCGGPDRITVFYNNNTAPAPQAPSTTTDTAGWALIGCFSDVGPDSRTLTYAQGVPAGPDGMTVEACTSSCQLGGYSLAGVEYSHECYCGNTFSGGGVKQADLSTCNMPCAGNKTESCGGPNRLNVYNFNNTYTGAIPTASASASGTASSTTAAAAATSTATVPNWSYLGCYVDASHTRTLLYVQQANANPTVETCITACAAGGYTLAGVEYGGECWCDNTLHNNGQPAPDGNAGCNMPCKGNANEICGGSDRLSVYTPASLGWQSLGCWTDSVAVRTLKTNVAVPGGANAMTTELCQQACNSQGFKLAGTEYSGECYCDNQIQTSGKQATDGRCNMKCNGNQTEICGGPNGLTMYSLGYYNVTQSQTTTTSASATATTASATTSATTNAQIPAGWNYTGCYVDAPGSRIMLNQQPDNNQMTIESCINACNGLGYVAAGMEYQYQCFCDSYLRNGAQLSPKDSDCAMSCSGNAKEVCGGPNLVSVYSKGAIQIYQPPKAQNTTGNWKYQGCLSDSSTGTRTFPYQMILKTNNTAANCLNQCAKFGFPAGGMEYGEECYCGDQYDITAAGATIQPDTDCNMACTGNGSFICGAGNRISYYTWQGPALYNWTYAAGNAAGRYDYLIDAPVIPLITTAGKNGKVTIIEKFGTSLTPGTTGAYELDLSLVSQGAGAAWRTMHVKTDVFCAAGVVLPDKAARVLNVGGWSYNSLYGVRLYTPDGAPGLASKNDWEEDYTKLSLQVGRWYPTAMVMSNGSILVMGGEDGSNGKPVPSLEVLPNPNKVAPMYCDYLERTDPYNLYPFLAVMPSGNILTSYYNEARLLDPVSLQTVKVLPNLPGSVNNFLAGRTYPLEGTFMMLPQYAPYTAPLEVVLCGGSVPAPNAPVALDNCVSIAPDTDGATWNIERMPSKRVISCMTALPDGTYLIVNGAQYGEAGFGLASQPNHNAVLYDPSKPRGSRMTVMANTTISRMYHSEAILLDDGRVLISGSDPQDNRFPQEYRIETFSPPYLLSGLAKPTFTMANTDWAYGQQITFSVTSGSTANLRVSLMAAVSSTHGASMGQRTLFPAVACSGNTCTVTAPPNNKVCPPGWFQMYVLDGPTPSMATWVRIGGDPSSLGNWPANTQGFTTPGM